MAARGKPAFRASAASSRLRVVSPLRKFCWSSTYTPSGAVPLPVFVQQPASILSAAFRNQLGQRPVAAPGEQYNPIGVFRQSAPGPAGVPGGRWRWPE